MPFIETCWCLFCMVFGLMLFFTLIMSRLSANFYTKDVVVKKFSIIDLELPATAIELVNVTKGLFSLDEEHSKKALRAVRWHLIIDFIYMPFAYGSVFILCMLVAGKMNSVGVDIFIVLAWLQIVPWICDIIENIYLFGKIKPDPVISNARTHRLYLFMQTVKWGIALTAVICAVAAICYFWLAHLYYYNTLQYALIIIGEIILFFCSCEAYS